MNLVSAEMRFPHEANTLAGNVCRMGDSVPDF